jgi:hypothetical protein
VAEELDQPEGGGNARLEMDEMDEMDEVRYISHFLQKLFHSMRMG